MNDEFLKSIVEVLKNARKNAKTAVNITMVYAYFEIGRMIVEEEQNGKNRAAYGKQILQELSVYLTAQFGKGFSVGNLKNIRQFYRIYAHDQIGETVFSQFENQPATKTGRHFGLSWSHYLKLMRIDNVDERHFYEIEAVKNDWSLSELKRQFNSALYERLLLANWKIGFLIICSNFFWSLARGLPLWDGRCALPLTRSIFGLTWFFTTGYCVVLFFLT